MHFNCRSFIGKNTSNFWSQTWENEPDSLDNQLHLFGLISLQTQNDSIDLKTIGRELIDQINQSFFTQTDGTIDQKLLHSIDSYITNHPQENIEINLILAVNCDTKIYLAVYGQNLAILQRGSQISQLISGVQNQIFQISGPIKNNDRLLLTTSDFVDKISWEKIKSTLVEPKIQNIEETLIADLYSLENQANLASFLIEIHSENSSDEIPIATLPKIEPEPPEIITPPSVDNAPPTIPINPPLVFPPKNPQPDIYVKSRFKFKIGNHKKIQLLFALFLLVGLLISLYFGYQKNQTQKAETSFKSLKSELETKLNNISVVKNLNAETTYQSAKEAKDIITKMSQLNIHSDEVNQYKSQVDLILSQSGDSDSFKPDVVYDTSLITNSPKFSKLLFSKSNLYLLDSTNGRIDSIIPQDKSTKNVLISDQIKSSSKILVDNNNLYLLSSGKISLIEKSGLTQKIDLSSSSITDAQFWNGSLYILDKNSQSIFKSTPSASGYSSPQSWLKNDAKLELGATSLSIDSQIWVLTESGRVYLYNSGLKSKFNQNQENNFTKAANLIADPNSDYLVFSDNSKFIYIYKKSGEFAFKFNTGSLQILDVSFDASNKIIYFLASDQKIYKISL